MDKNVFLLMGNWVERQEALSKIKESIGVQDYSICDNDCSFEYLQQRMMDNSCFGEKRIIIVKDLPTIDAPSKSQARTKVLNRLKTLLPKIPKECYVIFDGITIKSLPFLKAIEGNSKICIYEESIEKEKAKKYIYNFLEKNDKKMDANDMMVLINAISRNEKLVDVASLLMQLKKINHYVGQRKVITNQDILTICLDINNFIMWDLFRALDEKKVNDCYNIIDKMISFSSNIEQDVSKILFTLMGRYKLLLLVKGYLVKDMKKDQILDKITNLNKIEKTGMGDKRKAKIAAAGEQKEQPLYSVGYFNSLFFSFGREKSAIMSYTKKELMTINIVLSKCWIKIRSESLKDEMINILETICIVICNMIKKNNAISVLKNSYMG